VTGHVEPLTGAPRVSLQGLSTLFTTVTRAVTAMIRGSGDGDYFLDRDLAVKCGTYCGTRNGRPVMGLSSSAVKAGARCGGLE
jgi:hypothetical protein